MKKRIVFFIACALAAMAAGAFCYGAQVEELCGEKYFPAVMKAISEAKESITMVMFKAGLRPYDKESKVYRLVEALIDSHKRGVKVRVILDRNIPFAGNEGIEEWEADDKNAWCYKMLKDAGVEVHYDEEARDLHAKALVTDEEIVILGSANWTESALTKNAEVNVLVRSKELAREILQGFEEIEIDDAGGGRELMGLTPVAWKFLERPGLAGRMMSLHDERAFDLYLLLLREFDGNKAGEVALDLDKAAKQMGLDAAMDRTGYRRQIIRSARMLEGKYGLARFEFEYAAGARAFLLDYEEPSKAYGYPRTWYFEVPEEYWALGWDKRLSMRAKFCYLINLAYAGISDARPWWFASREVLAERFHTSRGLISAGMQELRRWNLIDVEYPALGAGMAKSYKVLGLYDPARLEQEWQRMEERWGAKRLKQARKFAAVVFEENDAAVVEEVIQAMDRMGEKKVAGAFGVVAKKSVDNPKRNYRYVRGVMERMQGVK
ncbi:MAG: phospholipase D-like domain-containing protein [Candidatus Omnitrophica bacterium]|nr:phospholipase D-like domain-containing protein [Candidatus Omnitrophota bacterium]